MIWSLFLFLIVLKSEAWADSCPSTFVAITGDSCTESRLGCNITNAQCSSTNGCNTRVVKGITRPGGIQSFCIDPGKAFNFLNIKTVVDAGCGTVRTKATSPNGWNVASNSGSLTLDAKTNTITPPITIEVIGEARPDSFTGGYYPGGGGGDITGPTCDPPATSSGN